jgi:hypothetical protein
MSKSKHTLFEAVLARMSLGAVPMDGVYWFDPKALRERAEQQQAQKDGCAKDKVHEHHSN